MEILDLFSGYDLGAVAAILAFSSLIKTYINITERYVPLIPVALGAIAGLLKFFTDTNLGEVAWYNSIAGMLLMTLIYAGIASIVFKVYKTTFMKDKPVITDAIKKML